MPLSALKRVEAAFITTAKKRFLRRTPFSSLTYAELWSRFPSRFIILKVLVEAGLVAFSSACFEFTDEVPKGAQHGSLAHLPKIFSSHFYDFSKVAAMGFYA